MPVDVLVEFEQSVAVRLRWKPGGGEQIIPQTLPYTDTTTSDSLHYRVVRTESQ